MTYNTGVFIMVSSGLAIGYALTPEDKIAGKPNFYELSSQDTFFRGPNS